MKAALLQGDKIHVFQRDYPRSMHTAPGQQSVRGLTETLRAMLRHILDQGDTKIQALCLDGHGPSTLFLNKQGEPVSDIVTWQNRSAEKEAALLRESIPGFSKDGTSYEAKVLNAFRTCPDLFEPGNTVLYPKDYCIFLLTGARVIDRSAASTIFFYPAPAYRAPESETYCGIPAGVLPQSVDSWNTAGYCGTEFSRECGLPDSIPVFTGGIDAFCEAVGAGATGPGQLTEGTGTSTCISCSADLPENGGAADRWDLHVIPGKRICIEMMSFTGGSLLWLMEILGEKLNTGDQSVISALADPENPTPLLFLPYLAGERSPVWDEHARGGFIGLTDTTGRKEMVQSVMQGIGFGIRQNISLLEQNTGVECTEVRAVGGGAKSREWLQIKADIAGKPFYRMGGDAGAALGAAIIAAAGTEGREFAEVCREYAQPEEVLQPDPGRHAWYSDLFDEYTSLFDNLKKVFHRQHELAGKRAQEGGNTDLCVE